MALDLTHGFFDLPYTEMVWIEPDSFLFQEGEEETKQITFEKGFWVSKCPVTQELYEQVMGINPSYFKRKHHPVERVSLLEAQAFLKELNEQVNFNDGLAFHLPSEAMWEYVARANEKTQYSGSHVLAEVGWYRDNSYYQTMPVGLKEPNGFGLYDLSGNVWECCTNDYEYSIKNSLINGLLLDFPNLERDKVRRGGAYSYTVDNCRVMGRLRGLDTFRFNYFGFRIFRY